MEIRIEKVLELIKQRSKSDQGSQPERKPPDEVDPERQPGPEPQDRPSRPDGDIPGL
jgi:hypothetical protein